MMGSNMGTLGSHLGIHHGTSLARVFWGGSDRVVWSDIPLYGGSEPDGTVRASGVALYGCVSSVCNLASLYSCIALFSFVPYILLYLSFSISRAEDVHNKEKKEHTDTEQL